MTKKIVDLNDVKQIKKDLDWYALESKKLLNSGNYSDKNKSLYKLFSDKFYPRRQDQKYYKYSDPALKLYDVFKNTCKVENFDYAYNNDLFIFLEKNLSCVNYKYDVLTRISEVLLNDYEFMYDYLKIDPYEIPSCPDVSISKLKEDFNKNIISFTINNECDISPKEVEEHAEKITNFAIFNYLKHPYVEYINEDDCDYF